MSVWCSTANPQSGCTPLANVCKPMDSLSLAEFQEFQKQLNRVMAALKKPTISVDGRLGPQTVATANDASRAINDARRLDPTWPAAPIFDTCDDIPVSIADTTALYRRFADARGAPTVVTTPATSPPSVPGPGGIITHPANADILKTMCRDRGFIQNSWCWFKSRPTWMQIGVAAGAGLVAVYAFGKIAKTKKAA